MTAEQVLIEKFQVLPEEKKARVLEFVEELQKNLETDNGSKVESDEKIKENARFERLMQLKGIGKSGRGDVSQRVDEILAEGINKREGWSLP